MDVKPGYKQTEVGVIPEDWEVSTIGAQSVIFGRIGFRGYTVNDIVQKGSGAVAINPSNIQDGRTVFDKCTYISWKKYEESPEIMINEGDIILVKTGSTFGKTATVRNLPEQATLNPQMLVFKNVKAVNGFLGYMVGSNIIQGQIGLAIVGGALPTLSQKLVASFRFPLPPKEEQQAIATALSDVDALIAKLDQHIAKKHDLRQAAMQELLTGRRRLLGFTGQWHLASIGDLGMVGRGRVISHREISKSLNPLYPVYSSQTSANGIMGYINTFDFEGEYVTWTTDGANAGTVFFRNGRFNCTNVCGTIKLNSDNPQFVARVLSRAAPHHVSRHLGNPKLMNDVMKRVVIRMPSVPEQTAIATVLSDMDAEIAALEARRDKTRLLKQGLMQELLTGRIRLL